MKRLLIILFLASSMSSWAQQYPDADFFAPYKYPKHYTYDGAFRINEFTAFFPKGAAGYGGEIKVDLSSFELGTAAVRLNLGFGFGISSARNEFRFPSTPLVDGTLGENYIVDSYFVPFVDVFPRVWIRILDPLNLSLSGGPTAYVNNNKTVGHFTVNNNNDYWNVIKHELELTASSSKVGVSYFVDARAMVNFRNWGVFGGYSKRFNGFSHTWQPAMGIWFGVEELVPVVN